MSQPIQEDELTIFIDKVLSDGLIPHHLDSFGKFTQTGIKSIIEDGFTIEKTIPNTRNQTPEDRKIDKIHFKVVISGVKLQKPQQISYKTGKPTGPMFPNIARAADRTYIIEIYGDITIIATAFYKDQTTKVKEEKVENFRIAGVPSMIRSKMCNTYGMSKEALLHVQEDPKDFGGYFIIKGNEWVIDIMESMIFNQFKTFKNVGHGNELSRGEIISKIGDNFENSTQVIIRYLNNNHILISIHHGRFYDKPKRDVQIPFYILFRALGVTSDKEIYDHILYEYDSTISKKMKTILDDAFTADATQGVGSLNFNSIRHEYDPTKILNYINQNVPAEYGPYVNPDKSKVDEEIQKYYNEDLLRILDTVFLPHIGNTSEARGNKIKFLGFMVRKLLLTYLDIVQQTDRDSYEFKRVHTAGILYSKVLKTQFNLAIAMKLKNNLSKMFKNTSFDLVALGQTAKSAISASKLQNNLIQAIISGDKEVSGTVRYKNRLSSQQLHRKNALTVISTLRQINTPNTSSSKQDVRSDEMRRVHPTYVGYICHIQSADTGIKVGIHKQMASSCTITSASSSHLLKQAIRADPDIHLLNDLLPFEVADQCKIFVNGDWIGCIYNGYGFANKYRQLRRQKDSPIDPLTTIYWNPLNDEVNFWVDAGRLIRPLLLVENNKLKLTRNQLDDLRSNKITMEDLRLDGVLEFISPEEQLNCLIAPSLNALRENTNDLIQYTHCDIPQATMGLVALTSPYANHNQAPRVTYQTNQAKQTGGLYANNFPFRIDKAHLQYYNETPLVNTITNHYINSNGNNIMLAIACYGGYNQEDSLIFNKDAIDKGLFSGFSSTFEKTELETHQKFQNPDMTTTKDIKSHASYDKLTNGYIKPGTIVQKNDIIIGKTQKLGRHNQTNYVDSDHSIMYKLAEPALVERVIKTRNEEEKDMCKVKLTTPHKPGIGDKFCLTPDHEVLTENGWKSIDQVTTNDKVASLVNDIIEYVNPLETFEFDHNGDMCEVKSKLISLCTTLNHKMYVRVGKEKKYKLVEVNKIIDKDVHYKKYGNVNKPIVEYFTLPSFRGHQRRMDRPDRQLPMTEWLYFLGIYIAEGNIDNSKATRIYVHKDRVRNKLDEVIEMLGFTKKVYHRNENCYYFYDRQLSEYLSQFGKAGDKYLPKYVFNLPTEQIHILIDALLIGDGCVSGNSCTYSTSSKQLADDLQKLCIHSGWTSNINKSYKAGQVLTIKGNQTTRKNDLLLLSIIKSNNITPLIHSYHNTIVNYEGKVYCLTVPSHIFMVRKDGKPVWTGNSARSGQKGVIGNVYTHSDMPFTKDGRTPDIIMNPHSIPSRMTVGQLIEGLVSQLAATKGYIIDGTIFSNIDIDHIGDELEKLGLNRHGREKLYNGMTGEFMDYEIFFVPTYYQELLKFVRDEKYAVSHGPTCAITRQPLGGKASNGGLKVGEMEKDCIIAHGSMRMLSDKFRKDSNGFEIYVCRKCGYNATVNLQKNIYKCKVCKNDADIAKVDTTWSSNLFFNELRSMGVDIKFNLKDHQFTRSE